MRLTTHYHHTRYEENGSEGKFSLRMPRRKSSLFKPPVLIQFQVTADTCTQSLPDGPMMGRSGRRLWPVCGISRPRNSSISACSMATAPTPWPKKGGWHWLLGLQTPEGREGHCHHR